MRSARASTDSARREMSPRLPIGVATRWRPGESGRSIKSASTSLARTTVLWWCAFVCSLWRWSCTRRARLFEARANDLACAGTGDPALGARTLRDILALRPSVLGHRCDHAPSQNQAACGLKTQPEELVVLRRLQQAKRLCGFRRALVVSLPGGVGVP